MKILIAEEEDILKKVLQEKFAKEDCDIKVVSEGTAVISAVGSFKPDIILLDIIIPNQDGVSILHELKADVVLRDIPVIITSNLGEDEKIKQALRLGAVDYLVKTQHSIDEIIGKILKFANK